MKKYLIYFTIAILLGFVFYKKVYIPKHTFKTTAVTQGNMPITVSGVGTIGAKDIYKIGSLYGGSLLSFGVDEGDFIKVGDLIAQIDEVDLKDKIDEQKANINKLSDDIKSLELDKQIATVQYKYQNSIFVTNQKLFKKRSIAKLTLEKYKTNRDVAKLQISTIASKINSLYHQIDQLKANSNGLNKRLSKYTINSPIDGYITKKLISNFQIINPNQNLIEIVNPEDIWIETHIDTRISGEIKLGDKADIKLRSSNKILQGRVINIKPINNSVTNEREIDIAFEKLPIPFYLNEQAIIDIKINQLSNIIKIPLNALTIFKEKTGVWIVKESKVKFKPLKILGYGNRVAATRELSVDDILAIPNPKNKAFRNGMKIIAYD
ncbi:MAG: HlyD family efflux transporter periplasmic adaptor subunit [Sulfurovum sp.]